MYIEYEVSPEYALANIFKMRRKWLKKPQAEVAKKAKISIRRLSQIEKMINLHGIKLVTVLRLLSALDFRVDIVLSPNEVKTNDLSLEDGNRLVLSFGKSGDNVTVQG